MAKEEASAFLPERGEGVGRQPSHHFSGWRAERTGSHSTQLTSSNFRPQDYRRGVPPAEVELVLFAGAALEVMREVPPAYGSRCSEHTFGRPRLMTRLRLRRFEAWTSRGAAARLATTRRRA